jgi:hypothetical protein
MLTVGLVHCAHSAASLKDEVVKNQNNQPITNLQQLTTKPQIQDVQGSSTGMKVLRGAVGLVTLVIAANISMGVPGKLRKIGDHTDFRAIFLVATVAASLAYTTIKLLGLDAWYANRYQTAKPQIQDVQGGSTGIKILRGAAGSVTLVNTAGLMSGIVGVLKGSSYTYEPIHQRVFFVAAAASSAYTTIKLWGLDEWYANRYQTAQKISEDKTNTKA